MLAEEVSPDIDARDAHGLRAADVSVIRADEVSDEDAYCCPSTSFLCMCTGPG